MKPEVLLRDVEPGDLPIFFEHQRDPVAVALVVFRSRDRAEFDEHWARILADDTSLKKTIVADGQVAGHIASFVRDGEREVGYWIDRALWGRGIASEALSSFLRLEQRRPLYAGVAPTTLPRSASCKNVASPYARARSIRNPSPPVNRIFFSASQRRKTFRSRGRSESLTTALPFTSSMRTLMPNAVSGRVRGRYFHYLPFSREWQRLFCCRPFWTIR